MELRYDADIALTGYLALPEGQPTHGAVLVAHDATGLGAHAIAAADQLAGLGYAALALDLYGVERSHGTAAEWHERLVTTPGLMRERALAGLAALAATPTVDSARIAAIGFCQGGMTVMELARTQAPIRCAIGFHPGLARPAESVDGPIDARILMLVGDRDPVAPDDARAQFVAELRERASDWQLLLLGGVGHSFTNPAVDALGRPGFAYDAAATQRAWTLALACLGEAMGGVQLPPMDAAR